MASKEKHYKYIRTRIADATFTNLLQLRDTLINTLSVTFQNVEPELNKDSRCSRILYKVHEFEVTDLLYLKHPEIYYIEPRLVVKETSIKGPGPVRYSLSLEYDAAQLSLFLPQMNLLPQKFILKIVSFDKRTQFKIPEFQYNHCIFVIHSRQIYLQIPNGQNLDAHPAVFDNLFLHGEQSSVPICFKEQYLLYKQITREDFQYRQPFKRLTEHDRVNCLLHNYPLPGYFFNTPAEYDNRGYRHDNFDREGPSGYSENDDDSNYYERGAQGHRTPAGGPSHSRQHDGHPAHGRGGVLMPPGPRPPLAPAPRGQTQGGTHTQHPPNTQHPREQRPEHNIDPKITGTRPKESTTNPTNISSDFQNLKIGQTQINIATATPGQLHDIQTAITDIMNKQGSDLTDGPGPGAGPVPPFPQPGQVPLEPAGPPQLPPATNHSGRWPAQCYHIETSTRNGWYCAVYCENEEHEAHRMRECWLDFSHRWHCHLECDDKLHGQSWQPYETRDIFEYGDQYDSNDPDLRYENLEPSIDPALLHIRDTGTEDGNTSIVEVSRDDTDSRPHLGSQITDQWSFLLFTSPNGTQIVMRHPGTPNKRSDANVMKSLNRLILGRAPTLDEDGAKASRIMTDVNHELVLRERNRGLQPQGAAGGEGDEQEDESQVLGSLGLTNDLTRDYDCFKTHDFEVYISPAATATHAATAAHGPITPPTPVNIRDRDKHARVPFRELIASMSATMSAYSVDMQRSIQHAETTSNLSQSLIAQHGDNLQMIADEVQTLFDNASIDGTQVTFHEEPTSTSTPKRSSADGQSNGDTFDIDDNIDTDQDSQRLKRGAGERSSMNLMKAKISKTVKENFARTKDKLAKAVNSSRRSSDCSSVKYEKFHNTSLDTPTMSPATSHRDIEDNSIRLVNITDPGDETTNVCPVLPNIDVRRPSAQYRPAFEGYEHGVSLWLTAHRSVAKYYKFGKNTVLDLIRETRTNMETQFGGDWFCRRGALNSAERPSNDSQALLRDYVGNLIIFRAINWESQGGGASDVRGTFMDDLRANSDPLINDMLKDTFLFLTEHDKDLIDRYFALINCPATSYQQNPPNQFAPELRDSRGPARPPSARTGSRSSSRSSSVKSFE